MPFTYQKSNSVILFIICRSYYRCTYKNTQNCWATKQVQRSDEDPTIFYITYRGTHTCINGNSVTQPASLDKQEKRLIQSSHSHNNLLNLGRGPSISNNGLENKEMACPFSFPPMLDETNFLGGFCSSFVPLATADSDYFLNSPSQMNNLGDVHDMQRSESDLTELLSANNSAANSPILNLDFSADLDPNFPFGSPEFSF